MTMIGSILKHRKNMMALMTNNSTIALRKVTETTAMLFLYSVRGAIYLIA